MIYEHILLRYSICKREPKSKYQVWNHQLADQFFFVDLEKEKRGIGRRIYEDGMDLKKGRVRRRKGEE